MVNHDRGFHQVGEMGQHVQPAIHGVRLAFHLFPVVGVRLIQQGIRLQVEHRNDLFPIGWRELFANQIYLVDMAANVQCQRFGLPTNGCFGIIQEQQLIGMELHGGRVLLNEGNQLPVGNQTLLDQHLLGQSHRIKSNR